MKGNTMYFWWEGTKNETQMAFETMDIDKVGQINNNLNNMIQQLFREQQHSSRLGR